MTTNPNGETMKDYSAGEPDSLDFESHGLKCALRRGPCGAWCGYVAIPADHPLHGLNYSESHPLLTKRWETRQHEPIGNAGIIPLVCANPDGTPGMDVVLAVHGSVTYTDDRCPCEEPDGQWWIGFDCSHAGDITPGTGYVAPGGVYRTIHYAGGECEALAGQLATMSKPKHRTMKRKALDCLVLILAALVCCLVWQASVQP